MAATRGIVEVNIKSNWFHFDWRYRIHHSHVSLIFTCMWTTSVFECWSSFHSNSERSAISKAHLVNAVLGAGGPHVRLSIVDILNHPRTLPCVATAHRRVGSPDCKRGCVRASYDEFYIFYSKYTERSKYNGQGFLRHAKLYIFLLSTISKLNFRRFIIKQCGIIPRDFLYLKSLNALILHSFVGITVNLQYFLLNTEIMKSII